MSEPIVAARPCPDSLLARSRNAKATVANGRANGWQTVATFACSADGIFSIKVSLRNDEGVRLAGLWSGEDQLGFDCGWRFDAAGLRRISYTELTHMIKGTEPKPTARQRERLIQERDQMMAAVQAAMRLGSPVKVLQYGTDAGRCHGKVRAGIHWIPCSAPPEPGLKLCDDCQNGVIFDGT